VLDSPNYSWRQSSNGSVYKVYDPQGAHLSPSLNPSSTFSESAAGAPVIDTAVPGPLTIDGATGEILNGVTLSRSLDAAQLASSASLLLGISNPYADAFRALTLVGTLAVDAYNAANPNASSGAVDPNDVCDTTTSAGDDWCNAAGDTYAGITNGYFVCDRPGGGTGEEYVTYCTLSTPPPSITPSSALTWAQANPSIFQSNLVPILNGSTADNLGLARSLGSNNAPLSSPIPYAYQIPSTNASVSGLSTTTSSTNPSTGNTTKTVSTPSYKFSTPSSGNGVKVTNQMQTVTSSCTSTGSCTVTNTSTTTSSNPQPKLGSFTAPAVSAPTSSSVSPTPFALNLKMPSQSAAVCPPPLSYTAFGTNFTIPLSPLCTLATDCRPYVESLGAVGAGIVIFR
jgi:hypothetical protein